MSSRTDQFRPGYAPLSVHHETALLKDQLTTDLQRARHARILDAAVAAAGAGGYELVHVRDVATRAGVSLATLYHYFPSKVHLLVRTLEREITHFEAVLDDELPAITGPYHRLRYGVARLITAMQRNNRVTMALAHAYVASNIVASVEAELIRCQTSEMFAHLMSEDTVPDEYRPTADLLTDVWTSEVLALVQGRRTYTEMAHRMTQLIDLLGRRS